MLDSLDEDKQNWSCTMSSDNDIFNNMGPSDDKDKPGSNTGSDLSL